MHKKGLMKILMLGPQASGKGTQAQILSDKFGWPIFSTGNILRQKAAEGDELGRRVAETMNRGELVSDDMVNKIVAEKIKFDGGKGYVLDGYPRNLSQAEFLSGQDELTHVFEIYVSDREAMRRVVGRRTCPKCQTVYHLEYNPPKSEAVCDKDGAKLIIRDDEQEEVVIKRLKNYHKLTEPIIEFYKSKRIYHKINGEQAIEKVSKDILAILAGELGMINNKL